MADAFGDLLAGGAISLVLVLAFVVFLGLLPLIAVWRIGTAMFQNANATMANAQATMAIPRRRGPAS